MCIAQADTRAMHNPNKVPGMTIRNSVASSIVELEHVKRLMKMEVRGTSRYVDGRAPSPVAVGEQGGLWGCTFWGGWWREDGFL